MYAQAGTVGRMVRERAERDRQRPRFVVRKPAEPKEDDATLDQRCFVPCVRRVWFLIIAGICAIAVGAGMCFFAFYAADYARISRYNSTEVDTNQVIYNGLKSLTYIGPTFIGSGAFCIIVACVVLLDKRDRIIKDLIDKQSRVQQALSRELAYRAVLLRRNAVEEKQTPSLISLLGPVAKMMEEEAHRQRSRTASELPSLYTKPRQDTVSITSVSFIDNRGYEYSDDCLDTKLKFAISEREAVCVKQRTLSGDDETKI